MGLWFPFLGLLTSLAAACGGGAAAGRGEPGHAPPGAPAGEQPTQPAQAPSSRPAPFPVESLAFRGETRVAVEREPRLRTRVIVTNTATRPVEIEYAPCTFNLRAYRHAHRTGRSVWEERKLPHANQKTGIIERACIEAGRGARIPPRGSTVVEDFSLEPSLRDFLGDSLPPGRYFFLN